MSTRTLRLALVLGISLALLPGATMAEEARPAEPGGFADDEPAPVKVKDSSVGEDGTPYPAGQAAEQAGWLMGKVEPILDEESMTRAELDVIIYLYRSAAEASLEDPLDVKARHMPGIKELSGRVQEILGRYKPPWSMAEEEERVHASLVDVAMTEDEQAELAILSEELDRRMDAMRADVGRAVTKRAAFDLAAIADRIEAAGGQVNAQVALVNALGATIPTWFLTQLAEDPKVRAIVKDHPAEYELNVSSPSISAQTWHNHPICGGSIGLYDAGLVDTGIQENHPAFASVNFYTDAGSPTDSDGHGTHVAGIMASANATYEGIAPCLDAMVWGLAGNQATTMSRMHTLASGLGQAPEVINHSLGYGTASSSDYNTNDTFYDAFIQNYDIMVTKSAGNGGWGSCNGGSRAGLWCSFNSECPSSTCNTSAAQTITHPAPAFNLMAVANMNDGGTTSRANDVRSSSSSKGPTVNSRRKPDIAAPGSSILSATSPRAARAWPRRTWPGRSS